MMELLDKTDLIARVRQYLPENKVELIDEAYRFAETAHEGQTRYSGEPYFQHPLHVALAMANLQLDASAVASALLHDVQEDCGVSNREISKKFGPEVARIVDGVSKLSRVSLKTVETRVGDDEIQAENLRRMFLAMAEDLRVVLIKLADRLHNMRTLDALPDEDRRRIAAETMEIYAPLAGRLGIWEIKWQLEDLAFHYLHPERYREIAQMLDTTRSAREQYIAEVEQVLREELSRHNIQTEVQGRAKHIYSIYQKMERYARQGRGVDDIHDLLAIRVLVDTVGDCYNALGVIHGFWRPIPGLFDDYISAPKDSMYQSLHTTVLCLGARRVEVQIRTYDMHRVAEYGVAAHWKYKEGTKQDSSYQERLAWLRQLLEWQRETAGASEFIESVKTDIFRDQVFVYTPKGEVKELPTGSTAIDLAYRIHTDLGHRCIGARVNGRLMPLNYQLRNGDLVEIIASKTERGPSHDWLNVNRGYVRTSQARGKIRQWFRRLERAENLAKGREMLEKELRRFALTLADIQRDLLQAYRYEGLDDLFAAIGAGEISTHQIALRMAPPLHSDGQGLAAAPRPSPSAAGVRVLGTGGLLTRVASCCSPVPGDPIVGYVTRGTGVSVHRQDCQNVLHSLDHERLVEVQWGQRGQTYPVAVRLEAWDRVGLMRDISTMVADEGVNMVGIHSQERADGTISIFMTLEIGGVEELTRLLDKLETVRGVLTVGRRLEGAAS